MISTIALFWALCIVCVVNMARYFSSLRALLVVLRGCDPLLYQYVDGGGFFYFAWAAGQTGAPGLVHLCPTLSRSSR